MKKHFAPQLLRETFSILALGAAVVSFAATSGHWIELAIVFAILSESYAID